MALIRLLGFLRPRQHWRGFRWRRFSRGRSAHPGRCVSDLVLMLKRLSRGAQVVPRFDIQMGESEATFNASYLTMEVIFPRRFATIS